MSSQRLGVSHMKFDALVGEARSEINLDALTPAGTTKSHSVGLFTMSLKYAKGLCRTTYRL